MRFNLDKLVTAWSPNTSYKKNQWVITPDGVLAQAKENNQSGSFDPTKWNVNAVSGVPEPIAAGIVHLTGIDPITDGVLNTTFRATALLDGGDALTGTASDCDPVGLSVDGGGNLLIADASGSRLALTFDLYFNFPDTTHDGAFMTATFFPQSAAALHLIGVVTGQVCHLTGSVVDFVPPSYTTDGVGQYQGPTINIPVPLAGGSFSQNSALSVMRVS